MTWLRRAFSALHNLVRRGRVEEDLDTEINDFLEASVEQKMKSGLSREAASRAARLDFGSVAAVKDDVRDVGWESTLSDIWGDLHYACRTLVKSLRLHRRRGHDDGARDWRDDGDIQHR